MPRGAPSVGRVHEGTTALAVRRANGDASGHRAIGAILWAARQDEEREGGPRGGSSEFYDWSRRPADGLADDPADDQTELPQSQRRGAVGEGKLLSPALYV